MVSLGLVSSELVAPAATEVPSAEEMGTGKTVAVSTDALVASSLDAAADDAAATDVAAPAADEDARLVAGLVLWAADKV